MSTIDLIKKAEFEHFQKQQRDKQYISQRVQDTKHIIQHFLPHLNAAKDLTNENIPLDVEKIGDNLYKFTRKVPQKLAFKTYEDAKHFFEVLNSSSIDYTQVIDAYTNAPFTPLHDTKLMSTSVTAESDLYLINSFFHPFFGCILALTIIAIPIAIPMFFEENKFKKKVVNTGLTVTIRGTFKSV